MLPKPLLYQYFKGTADSLLSQFELSKEQQSSRNLGDNRELFIGSFLDKVLPSRLKVDHGEIWDSSGNKTGQLDIIILRDDAPSLLFGDANTFLAEGVFAVIEIKSNLTKSKLQEALRTLNMVKDLQTDTGGMQIRAGSFIDRPLRCVFAFEGAQWKTLEKLIAIPQNNETIDLCSILNRGVIVRKGLLLNWKNNDIYKVFNGQAAALAMLYYHLVSYATSFLGRTLNFVKYFEPFGGWNE